MLSMPSNDNLSLAKLLKFPIVMQAVHARKHKPASLKHCSWGLVGHALRRYGLSDSDDEDDGGSQVPMQERTPPQLRQQASGSADKAATAQQGFGLFDEDENMDDDSGSDQTGAQGIPSPAYMLASTPLLSWQMILTHNHCHDDHMDAPPIGVHLLGDSCCIAFAEHLAASGHFL